MGHENTLRLAAAGWTIAVLLAAWVAVERRARKAAEFARDERERESNANQVERIRRQREAIELMRAAFSVHDRASTHDE